MFEEKQRLYKTQALSPGTKMAILKYIDQGHTIRETAAHFNFHNTTIYKIAKASSKEYKTKSSINVEELKEYVLKNPGLRLKDYANVFNVSAAAIHHLLKRNNISNLKEEEGK